MSGTKEDKKGESARAWNTEGGFGNGGFPSKVSGLLLQIVDSGNGTGEK